MKYFIYPLSGIRKEANSYKTLMRKAFMDTVRQARATLKAPLVRPFADTQVKRATIDKLLRENKFMANVEYLTRLKEAKHASGKPFSLNLYGRRGKAALKDLDAGQIGQLANFGEVTYSGPKARVAMPATSPLRPAQMVQQQVELSPAASLLAGSSK